MEPGNRGTRVMPCVPAHDSEDFDRDSSLSRQLTLKVPRVDLTERPGCLPRLADAGVSDRRAAVGLAPKPRTSLAKDPAPASNSFPNSLSTATWLTSFKDRVYHGVYRVACHIPPSRPLTTIVRVVPLSLYPSWSAKNRFSFTFPVRTAVQGSVVLSPIKVTFLWEELYIVLEPGVSSHAPLTHRRLSV